MNDIAFHPTHGTLATVGSDGRFSFWDKDARTKLKVGVCVCVCACARVSDVAATVPSVLDI